jgi:hypothetical protein
MVAQNPAYCNAGMIAGDWNVTRWNQQLTVRQHKQQAQ